MSTNDNTETRSYTCHGQLNKLAEEITAWREEKGFECHWGIVPEKLMLTVSELGEAMEAFRHLSPELLVKLNGLGLQRTMRTLIIRATPLKEEDQDSLAAVNARYEQKHLDNFKEEIADTMIRLLDMCGALQIDIEDEIFHKMLINEGRELKHGKER